MSKRSQLTGEAQREVSVTTIVKALAGADDLAGTPLPMRSRLGQLAHSRWLDGVPPEEREVSIRGRFQSSSGWELFIHGRIDRVERSSGVQRVVEFKSSSLASSVLSGKDYQTPRGHLLQTKLYCWLLAQQFPGSVCAEGKVITVSLVDDGRMEIMVPWLEDEVRAQLERFVELCQQWDAERSAELARRRSVSRALSWPFAGYRPGQAEMVETVEQVLRDGGDLLLQAPPGLGKSIGTLYPALRYALANGKQLFFATAKGEGRTPIWQAVEMLQRQGATIRAMVMPARIELCPMIDEPATSACDYCPMIGDGTSGSEGRRAEGRRYGRAVGVADVWESPFLNAGDLMRLARKSGRCPVALAREIMAGADLVIGDYNYIFNPDARLPAFQVPQVHDWILLIDEAHNLFDRVRAVNSEQVELLIMRGLMGVVADDAWRWRGASAEMDMALATLGEELEKLEAELTGCVGLRRLELDASQWTRLAEQVGIAAGRLLAESAGMMDRATEMTVWDICRMLERLSALAGRDSDKFLAYGGGPDVVFGVECLDPGGECAGMFARFENVIAFSGTLAPLDFYKRALGFGARPTAVLDAADPFLSGQRLVMAMPAVDSRWKSRPRQAAAVADVINRFIALKKGGYLAVFPSYEFINLVAPFLDKDGIDILIQQPEMGSPQRTALRRKLSRKRLTTLAVVVAGGQFTEAADYPGDACVGVVIVGPCLPPPTPLREALSQYWSERGEDGFGVAYAFPGMRKVAQAGGRLIRGETDRGVILLLDDRFVTEPYYSLLPAEWRREMTTAGDGWEGMVREFWRMD